MSNSINSTLSAQTAGACSFLNTPISTSSAQPSAQAVVLPYVGNLAGGQYTSEIVAVYDAVQNGAIVGIDCTHKLTDSSGKTLLVKFRYFAPSEVNALIAVLAGYGLTGNIGTVLTGLQETVNVVPRPGSNRYMSISQRTLMCNTATVTVSTQGASLNNMTNRKSGGLTSRLSGRHGSKPVQAQRQSLLSEEDDDDDFEVEFDD